MVANVVVAGVEIDVLDCPVVFGTVGPVEAVELPLVVLGAVVLPLVVDGPLVGNVNGLVGCINCCLIPEYPFDFYIYILIRTNKIKKQIENENLTSWRGYTI